MALLALLSVVCLIGLHPVPGWAGPAGFSILRLTSGARTSGLADAGVALADGDALSVNPAALLVEGGGAFGLTHSEWIEEIRHEYLTAAYKGGGGGDVVGLQAQLFHAGGLEHRVGPSAEPLGEFGVYEWSLGVAWSRPFSDKLRLGVGAKLLRQSIFAESGSMVAMSEQLEVDTRFNMFPRRTLGQTTHCRASSSRGRCAASFIRSGTGASCRSPGFRWATRSRQRRCNS